MLKSAVRWTGVWRSRNALDGTSTHVLYENCIPVLFCTRKEVRAYIQEKYGYIKTREDLRSEPHGWRIPIAVRAEVVVLEDRTDAR